MIPRSFLPSGHILPTVVGNIATACTTRNLTTSNSALHLLRPIVELRENTVHPHLATEYLALTKEAAHIRTSILPLRLFALSETGGPLHKVTHAYFYAGGHLERDAVRQRAAENPAWQAYVSSILPCLATQSSTIWSEASLILKHHSHQVKGLATTGAIGGSSTDHPNCILEFRLYKLKLGYDTVPNFLSLYHEGLESKLAAPGTDPTTALVTVLSSDVGRLNEVIEIWRHGGGSQAMERSRQAARQATEWKQAIARIAGLALEFTSTIHKPTSFSPSV